jgi:hypothetical protein
LGRPKNKQPPESAHVLLSQALDAVLSGRNKRVDTVYFDKDGVAYDVSAYRCKGGILARVDFRKPDPGK